MAKRTHIAAVVRRNWASRQDLWFKRGRGRGVLNIWRDGDGDVDGIYYEGAISDPEWNEMCSTWVRYLFPGRKITDKQPVRFYRITIEELSADERDAHFKVIEKGVKNG